MPRRLLSVLRLLRPLGWIVAACAALCLAGCAARPEEEVRAALDRLVAIFNQEDERLYLKQLTPDFPDRENLQRKMGALFIAFNQVLTVKEVQSLEVGAERVVLAVTVTRTRFRNQAGEVFGTSFPETREQRRLTFVKRGGKWLLQSDEELDKEFLEMDDAPFF